MVVCVCFTANADFRYQAVGARASGGISGLGLGLGYHGAFEGGYRLEFGFCLNANNDWEVFGGDIAFQWHKNLKESVNWYIGPAALVGVGMIKNGVMSKYFYDDYDDLYGFYLGLGGQIGIEYELDAVGFPGHIGISTSPIISIVKPKPETDVGKKN